MTKMVSIAGVENQQITHNIAAELRAAVSGRVIVPEDADYDALRTPFYGGHDRRPAVIVRPANAQDVASVVRLAVENNIELAVRSGGHSLAGHSASEGGIVLDLRDMRDLKIDVGSRTAWAEGGLTAGEFTAAAQEHGLAVGFGDTATVGIGGITLGGGVGYLTRKHGMTIDHLLAAEVVTADGKILLVDQANHPDLFWAIRGGGGNFGVVTRFKYQLHEVKQIVGGMLFLPATPEVIAGFITLAQAAPEELSTIANIMAAPPMPFLPAEVHGQMVLMGLMVYAGDVEAGLRAVAPFRALAKPLADLIRPMNYLEMYPPEEGGYHPISVTHTLFMDQVSQKDGETILSYLKSSTAVMSVAQIRVLGGAAGRVPNEATAYAHRQHPIMVTLVAVQSRPDEREALNTWITGFAGALNQGYPGAYVNFVGDEGVDRVRAAYPPATWKRLAAVKARYDPANLFRLNQNIEPDRTA